MTAVRKNGWPASGVVVVSGRDRNHLWSTDISLGAALSVLRALLLLVLWELRERCQTTPAAAEHSKKTGNWKD